MYAKINNGELVSAPRFLWRKNGFPIMNPTEDDYLNAGYFLFEPGEMPDVEDGYYAVCDFEQTERELIQIWRVLKDMRPMPESEVNRMLIAQQINTLSVDDNTALRMKAFYPTWERMIGKTLAAEQTDFKVSHRDKLWKVISQGYTFQKQWEPGAVGTESIFTEVCETHSGELSDPIPYDGNMALENGKYYIQNGVVYLCNRDTVNPVYQSLAELVGIYVEIV